MRAVSVNAGGVRSVAINGEPEPTAFMKHPVEGPVRVTVDGLSGNRLATSRSLGVANHAVYIYPVEHYAYWEADLGREGLPAGSFGENLTVEGLVETDMRIGDELVIGSVRLRVIQPRIPCYKLAHFLNAPQNFPARFLRSARVGAYCSVVREGYLQAGDRIEHVPGDPSNATIAEFVRVTQFDTDDVQGLTALLDSPGLIPGWRTRVEAQLSRATGSAAGASGWAGWRTLRCTHRTQECEDVVSFVFSDADGGPLAPCVPGQFLTMRIGTGRDATVVRTYTISGAYPSYDNPSRYRITVKREERGGDAVSGSAALHEGMKAGAEIEARPPAGRFTLDLAGDRPVVFVAGGIGVTPMVAMLNALAARGDRREMLLMHSVRNDRHRPLGDEAASLSSRLARLDVHVKYSRAGSAERNGRPDRLKAADIVVLSPDDAVFFLCGPNSFMQAIAGGLAEAGIDSGRIFTEAFGPSSLAADAGATALQPSTEDVRIRFETSGVEVVWTPEGGSLLDLLEAQGIAHDASCRSGICQTCAAELVSGQVTYPPGIGGAGQAQVLLCSALPVSDLVLRV